MKEYVFLPDRSSDPRLSFDTLASAMSGAAKVSMSSRAASPSKAGFSETTIATAIHFANLSADAAQEGATEIEMVDYVEKTGAILLNASEVLQIDNEFLGQIVPVHYYLPAIAEVRVGRSKLKLNSGPSASNFLTAKFQYSDNHGPVLGAVVNLRRTGQPELSAVTDINGVATFALRMPSVTNARLMVEAGFSGHWGYSKENVSFSDGDVFDIERIDLLSTPDALRYLVTPGGPTDGAGVRVGVVDSGVGPHQDLKNAVGDSDSSMGHGSHVAGIIGGQGSNGLGGIAPGVDILSYRVFDDPETGISRNFEIHRAIEQAIEDDCHLVNLSLKSEFPSMPEIDDPVISRALEDAADAGVLCIAAAGNDFRRFVAFPARHPDAIAVSALGWEPGMPQNAFDSWTATNDRSTVDNDVFFANFSNEGVNNTSVDLTGPGAGIISTVPGDTYAPMSGTSMACPAMVGAIAKLLSNNPGVVNMPPDRNRTQAMRQLIQNNIIDAGFNEARQGAGILK